jgi:peptidoglycan/LPS O-acetylase OafA/YrhL
MFLNFANGLICYRVKTISWAYIICIELNYLVIGGIYSVYPASVIKTFGIYYGPQIYSIILIAGALVSVFSLFAIKVAYEILGISEEIILAVGSICSLIAIVINCSFNEKIDLVNMNKRGLLVYGDPPKNKK